MVKADRYVSRPKATFSRSQEKLLSEGLLCLGKNGPGEVEGESRADAAFKTWAFQDGNRAHLVEYSPSMQEALGLVPSTV